MGAFGGFLSGFSKSGGGKKLAKAVHGSNSSDSDSGSSSGGDANPEIGQFKKGGKVKKTGKYGLHKGERVLNVKQTRKYDRKK